MTMSTAHGATGPEPGVDGGPSIDPRRLEAWMDRQGPGSGPLRAVQPISGGSQNVVMRFRRGAEEFVLRHPPLHKRDSSDETMRREARLLDALEHSDVPHPRLICACAETETLGGAFYLMAPVSGFNPSRGLPEPHASDAAMQHAMGLAMCDALAALGRVDPGAIGLADFGRPDGWLERQVARWRAQLDSYVALHGYELASLPGHDAIGRWLEANQPPAWSPGLIHGDFSLANVLIADDGPEVTAIVDWELATLGDPLLDLGHLLATWPRPAGRGPFTTLDAPGLPGEAELIDRYARGSDRPLEHVHWYKVLACYRLASILEGTYARSRAGLAPVAVGDRLHSISLGLIEQAHEAIAGN